MGLQVRARRGALGVLAAGTMVAAAAAAVPAVAAPSPVELQILSFNDYHGQVDLPTGSNATVPGLPGNYGGSQYLATTLTNLRAGKKHSLTVAAGDLIGASPIVSGLFHDEPSVESLNAMKLDVSSVGNHEFDEGVTELLRMQYGGCRADTGCYLPTPYPGARFPWLAANVTYKSGVKVTKPKDASGRDVDGYGSWFQRNTGRTVLPPTWTKDVDGIKVGFIGMTLEGTDLLVAQAGIRDVTFGDEVESANLAALDLAQRGVKAIVVLIHEGGLPPSGADYNFPCTGETGAPSISGPIVEIAQKLDAKIDLVVSGHTHQPYTCMIKDPADQPRWVTSAYAFGRLVTETNLKLDRQTKDVIRSSVAAVNRPVVRTAGTEDPALTAILTKWRALAAPIANRAVGTITADIRRGATRDVESGLSDLIADAQLDRTKVNGAQIALMNPGGVRADLTFASSPSGEGDGVVTYGEAFAVQPFGNTLMTMTLTGAQLEKVLEQQWASRSGTITKLHLGVSKGFTYTSREGPDLDDHIDPATMKLDGVTIDSTTSYRVTVNSFLADGGDSFSELRNGTERVGGGVDLDEFVAWLGANSPVSSPIPPNRVTLTTTLP